MNNTKHITIANIYIPPRDIHALQNRWHGHTTLHTVHHEHTTVSPHRWCECTLHSLTLVHWWPQRTTNRRWHQQLGPHNTKHKHTNQSAKDHTKQIASPYITTVSNTLYNRTSWTTQHVLSSYHLPILTTIDIRHAYILQQNRQTFTNYTNAEWTQLSTYKTTNKTYGRNP